MAFRCPSNRGVARHIADCIQRHGEDCGLRSQPCRCQRRLDSGMTGADDRNLIIPHVIFHRLLLLFCLLFDSILGLLRDALIRSDLLPSKISLKLNRPRIQSGAYCVQIQSSEGEGNEPNSVGTKSFVFYRPHFAYRPRIQSGAYCVQIQSGYLPTQKRSKTLSMTASEARSPVSSNRLSMAESMQTFTASSVSPASSACLACSIVLLASSTQAR